MDPVTGGPEGTAVHAGASFEAIAQHYDVGSAFFRTWLGRDMVYSAARWDPRPGRAGPATLELAQQNKIDLHLQAVRLQPGGALLDIGCGWGATLSRAVHVYGAGRAVGLTLSADQFQFVRALNLPATDVVLESYEDHPPESRYDAIVSVGAFEHFARPAIGREAKLRVYDGFFRRCRDWLQPGGRLSLQSICWGHTDAALRARILPENVFPDSDLPFLHEIIEAAHPHLEILQVENARDDYVRTLAMWLRRLREARPEIIASPGGEAIFARYEDYLRQAQLGFRLNRTQLVRAVFQRTSARGHPAAGRP